MRRITLFFVLLFMLCGSAVTWAQYTTQSLASVGETGVTSGFSSDKKYVLKTSSQGEYRTYMYDLKGTIRASKTLPMGVNAVNYLWTITANDNGTFKITNVHSGRSINIAGTSNGGAVNTTDAGSEITIEPSGNNVGLRNSGDQYIDMQSNGIAPVTWSGGVSGSRVFTILEANMEELTSTTWFKPQFGGELWTWDGENSIFVSASMFANATAPERKGDLGPVYKFADVEALNTSTNANTSDKGGIWVVGATSDVTCNLGSWAGSILVEDFATATVSFGMQMKGWEVSGLSDIENTAHATLWTNGTVNFGGGRQNFDMADGKSQRWYIGENGRVTSAFNAVSKGDDRTWEIQAVVADEALREGHTLISKTLTKKIMTWGRDLSGQINSIAAWYKNDQGTLTALESSAITYDATGITITYQGKGNNYKYDVAVSGYTGGGVTYDGTSYTNGGTFYTSSVLTQSDLTAAVAGSGFFDAIVSIEEVEANISYVIHVDYPAAVPFTPTTIENGDFAANTQWYRLEFNRTPKKYSKYNKTTEQATNSTTKETTRYTAFCFVEVEGGYQIYNKAAGASKPFSSEGNKFTTTGTTFTLEKFAGTVDGYLFHVKDVNNAYIHDLGNTLAVWTSGSAKNDPGSALLFAEAALTAEEMESIKLYFGELDALIARVEGVNFGTGLGEYQESTYNDFTAAVNAAYTVKAKEQPTQTEIDEATTNLQAQFDALVINMPATGKYYRFRVKSQDSNNTNYMSAYGNVNYLNTQTGDSQNKAATTFYLTAENQLQAAYNGAYIKQNNGGNLETTTNAAEAMTWTIEQGDVTFGTYRVKANEPNSYLYDWTTYSRGNVRISNEPAHPRCQWTIEEVEITDAEILAFDKPLLQTLALNNETRIEAIPVVEGAEIICPSEFGGNGYDVYQLNSIINDVLAALNSSDDVALYKTAHSDQKRHRFITSYKNLYNSYGGIVSISYELRSQYGTICLPINYSGPQNWKIYSCATINGSVLDLTDQAFSYNQNKPFIVEYTNSETLPTSTAPKKYQFIGYGQNGATTDQDQGCLTGVLTDGGTTVPTGSYVLSKYQGKVAFYQVAEGADMTCPQYKCYLTAPVGMESAKALFFTNDDVLTGIESILGGEETPVIYDLSGRRLNSLQKGVNIVNGHKVIVR